MKKILKYPLTLFLLTTIFIITIIDVLNKDISFSNYENRSLALKPNFYYSSFISGRFFKNYERYINDQFLLRNTWINIKSSSELALGKKENNGIIYGDNNFLFDKFDTINKNNLNKNISLLKNFISYTNANFNLMLIPESFSIYKEYLPYGVNLIDEINYIEKINDYFSELNNVSIINIINTFIENKDEYIYYKTDHHWTSYGAYLAYKEFCALNNLTSVNINDLTENKVNEFLGTYFSKSKKFNSEKDYIIWYDIPNIDIKIDNSIKTSLNDNSKWSSSDKYSAFTWGNNGVTYIKNKNIDDDSKLLIIKDSYANSFIQFIVNNYNEIYIVDLRSFVGSFNEFFNNNNFDNILIMYSFKNLVEDVNISRIKY